MTAERAPTKGVWEQPLGGTVEWYTPPELFERLGLTFDLDPCMPARRMGGEDQPPVPWVPTRRWYTPEDNGLWLPWSGRVWLNPPYGPSAPDFVERMAAHADGIALLFSRTETGWWQLAARSADAVCFPRDRLHFIRDDGYRGRASAGSTLFAWGVENAARLRATDLGWTT